MNVLVVSSKYPPEYSGSGHRAHTTYKRLSGKFGIKFNVIASSVASNASGRYDLEGVPVRLIANKAESKPAVDGSERIGLGRRIVNKAVSMRDYMAEATPTFYHLFRHRREYDLIHVFGNVNVTSAAISFAKMAGKPIIVELVNKVDNLDQYEPSLISAFWGRGFPRHALIVCISEHLRTVCLKHGYRPGQLWCRPNPIDESRFNSEKARKLEYRKALTGFAESDILVLQMAKFMPLKNQAFMLDVMALLPEKFKLLLAGPLVGSGPLFKRDQEYFDGILKAIKDKGLEGRVRVDPGFVEKPENLIKGADIFVMPSVREALGTPVLEALACGVPVIANDLPGIFDTWIKDGFNGYICPLDAKAWADRIARVCEIDDATLLRASEEILVSASTGRIDDEYFRHIRSLGGGANPK